VLYVDAREDGDVAILEDQNLVVDDDTLRITALQNEFQESGTGRITLERYPTQNVTADDIPEGDLTVTLPTRLGPGEYWEEAIDLDVSVINDGTYEDDDEYEVYTLTLENIDTTEGGELKLNTVGIQSKPSEGGQKQNVGTGGGGDSGTELPGTLTAEVTNLGQGEVTMTYDGAEAVDVTAEANNGDSDSNTIEENDLSVQLNLEDTGANIYPIIVTGENNSGQSCSAILDQGDDQIDVCG